MKKNVKILFSLIVGLIICSTVTAYAWDSKDLKASYDGRYCYYQGQGNQKINEEIMNKIENTVTNTGEGIQFTLPKADGISSYTIVMGGKTIKTASAGSKVTIKAEDANQKQIQIYRNASANVCRFSETNTKSDKASSCTSHNEACTIGYLNVFSDSYVFSGNVDSLATLTEKRNYTDGISTITIERKKEQATLTNGKKVDFKVDVYSVSNTGMKKLTSLKDTASSASFSIKPRGAINTIFVQYVATSGDARGAILASGDENYIGYEENTTKNTDYCKQILKNYKGFGNFMTICDPSSKYIDYGSNLDNETLKKKYTVFEEFYKEIIDTKVGTNSSLLTSVKKTSNPREKQELFCKFNQAKNQTETYTYDTREESEYFIKVCRETVKIVYDSPKLVSNNGGGFTYDVKIIPTVECYAKIKDDAWEKLVNATAGTQCTVKNACWGRDSKYPNYRDKGYWDGGPSEDFDACVNTCDNGKYTQACINSCYDKVYGNYKTSNTNILYSSSNNSLLNISYSGEYADDYTKYSDEWCSLPEKKDDPDGSKSSYTVKHHDSNGNPIGNHHTGKGQFYCVKAKAGNNWININKYFRTGSCESTCYTTITNPDTKNSKKFTNTHFDKSHDEIDVSVDSDNYVKELGCFLNTAGESISLNEKEIKDFVNEWKRIYAEVENMNEKGKNPTNNYDGAKYTYSIHDSSERFCDNKEWITYEEGSSKNPLSVTKSTKDIKLGFPNTCLKNGSVTSKNGCCTKEEGLSGGNKFYMAVTTENNINNVFYWPTDKANFDALEKETINKIRDNAQGKLQGITLPRYDADTYANESTKEYCTNEAGFNYNIKAKLEKLGFLGDDNNKWNFDINCFYGYYDNNFASCGAKWKEMDTDGDGQNDTKVITEDLCKDAQGNENKPVTTLVDNYLFRTVDVTNLFNNSNVKPWNWQTSETTKAVTESFQNRKINYIIDPDKTVENIQSTGYAYTDLRNFRFVMNSANMREIRKYNENENRITTAHCNTKDLGCSNNFIRDTKYFEKTDISNGIGVFNSIRDK